MWESADQEFELASLLAGLVLPSTPQPSSLCFTLTLLTSLSLHCALLSLRLQFASNFLQQIVSILLDQEHVKLTNLSSTGGIEKKCVEDSLTSSILLIATSLKLSLSSQTPNPHLVTLSMIFDPNRIFFRKPKHAYAGNQSNEQFRKQLIKRFLEAGGAEVSGRGGEKQRDNGPHFIHSNTLHLSFVRSPPLPPPVPLQVPHLLPLL